MSEITRICGQCGKSSPLDDRYCPHCGHDSQAYLAPAPAANLTTALSKAAWPIVAGAAGLAARAAWKWLNSRSARTLAQQAVTAVATRQRQSPAPRTASATERRPRRTIRIRSAWAVGDANGVWQQGSSEHTIELDE